MGSEILRTSMLSDVGVRNEILAELTPSNPTMWPLYQRPSVWRNLHFVPIEYFSDSNGSGSIWLGSKGSTLTSWTLNSGPWLEKIASASFSNRVRFRWRRPSSASLIARRSSSWTFKHTESWPRKHGKELSRWKKFLYPSSKYGMSYLEMSWQKIFDLKTRSKIKSKSQTCTSHAADPC